MKTFRKPRGNRSFALISTLLILTVLTVMVTGFLLSMRAELLTSRSYLNLTRAQLAAESGLQVALNALTATNTLQDYHYVTGVERTPGVGSLRARPYMIRFAQGTTNIVGTNFLSSVVTNEPAVKLRVKENGTFEAGYVEYGATTNATSTYLYRFAYWIDETSSRQNVLVNQGLARTNLQKLSELPVISAAMSNVTVNPANTRFIYTPQTVNQVIGSKTNGADYEFTVGAPMNSTRPYGSAILTPEGEPRLNLTELKKYLDDHATPSELYQGPNSSRFLTARQLLNEFQTNSAVTKNPWGYGSMGYLTNCYTQTESRQIAANIVDYIDADIVPTTDGKPGDHDPIVTPGSNGLSGDNYNSNREIPGISTEMPEPPTVMGVEGRVRTSGAVEVIQGHPYITMFGTGLRVINRAGFTGTGQMAHWTIVNPWSGASQNWDVFYQSEVQLRPMEAGLDSFNLRLCRGWLSSHSKGFYPFTGSAMPGQSAGWFPRGGSQNGANMFSLGYNDNATPSSLFQINTGEWRISVGRLIYLENSTRYLVQDLSALKNTGLMIIPGGIYKPVTTANYSSAGSFKYIKNDCNYGPVNDGPQQNNFFLNSDPRLNFQTNSWAIRRPLYVNPIGDPVPPVTAAGTPSTTIDNSLIVVPPNAEGDDTTGLKNTWEWWKPTMSAMTNHFPTVAQGYRPSPGTNMPAMQTLGELGFISTGRPWQTLRLQPVKGTRPAGKEDWRFLQYVETGSTRRETNSVVAGVPPIIAVDGQINLASARTNSFLSLFSGIPGLTPSKALDWSQKYQAAVKVPLLNVGEAVSFTNFNTQIAADFPTEFSKEQLYGRFLNAITLQPQVFTVYVQGEVLRQNETLPFSKVLMRAEVLLQQEPNGTIKAVILKKSII